MRILHFGKLNPGDYYLEIMTLEVQRTVKFDAIGKKYLLVEKEYDNTILGNGLKRSFIGVYINDYKEPLTAVVGECVFHLDDMGEYIKEARQAIRLVLEYEL